MSGALAEELARCWVDYRNGLLGELARALPLAHALYANDVGSLGVLEASNATVELAMLDVIVGMMTARNIDEIRDPGDSLADMANDPDARCDDIHRLAGMACAVHAAMRTGSLPLAQGRFRAALAQAQKTAEGGANSAEMTALGTILGCAGLRVAEAAAVRGEEELTRAMLDQSDQTAAELGGEYEILGQYFGPDHARAARCICLAELGESEEAVTTGRAVNVDHLIPLVGATMLRALAEETERSGETAAAAEYRTRADALVPPLSSQFSSDGG